MTVVACFIFGQPARQAQALKYSGFHVYVCMDSLLNQSLLLCSIPCTCNHCKLQMQKLGDATCSASTTSQRSQLGRIICIDHFSANFTSNPSNYVSGAWLGWRAVCNTAGYRADCIRTSLNSWPVINAWRHIHCLVRHKFTQHWSERLLPNIAYRFHQLKTCALRSISLLKCKRLWNQGEWVCLHVFSRMPQGFAG